MTTGERGARQRYSDDATHTRVKLTFYSWGDGFSGVVDGFNPDFGHIIGVTTSKAIGDPKGSFNIRVKGPEENRAIGGDLRVPGLGYNQSFLRLWEDPEGVWVLIQWVCDGEVIDDMLGLVSTVTDATAWTGKGARNSNYMITGTAFGRVFTDTIPFVSVYDDPAKIPYGPLLSRLMVGFRGGAPGAYVEALVEAWIGNYENTQLTPWALPPGLGQLTFYDILQRSIGCREEAVDGLLQDPNLLNPDTGNGQNLWAALNEHTNPLMNELFCDMRPNGDEPNETLSNLQPTIILRRKPFKTWDSQRDRVMRDSWDALPIYDLEKVDQNQRQVAKGGPEQRFNYWTMQLAGQQPLNLHAALHGAGGDGSGYPGGFPIWNITSIERHGFRLWHQSTNYLPIGITEPGGDLLRQCASWLRRCHDWHSVAPMEMSGTLTTSRIRPEIRIGQRVREHYIDGPIEYYVEGIVNQWNYGGNGSTKITVTRGEYENERPALAAVYAQLNNRVGSTEGSVTAEELEITEGDVSGDSQDAPTAETGARGISGSRSYNRAIASLDDWLSAAEEDTQRAYNGQDEQTTGRPTIQLNPVVFDGDAPIQLEPFVFGEDELESGAPIPVDENSANFDDPLFGLDLDNLGP